MAYLLDIVHCEPIMSVPEEEKHNENVIKPNWEELLKSSDDEAPISHKCVKKKSKVSIFRHNYAFSLVYLQSY